MLACRRRQLKALTVNGADHPGDVESYGFNRTFVELIDSWVQHVGLDQRTLHQTHLVPQGRRHGFESGGDNFASGASKKIFFDPPLFGQWGGGTKYCLDS